MIRHPLLDEALGTETWIKLENTTPIGSFKIRGGVNLIAALDEGERRSGICAPTRGNHGQALAWAAHRAGVRCTLFVPAGNNPDKDRAMRAYGAEVRVAGRDFDEAHEAAEEFARGTGARYVHPGREPALIAGNGTIGLEMCAAGPAPFDAIFVPVGVGSLAAGVALACSAASPTTRVIGVAAAAAPAMHHAFHTGILAPHRVGDTLADGLAVGVPISATIDIMRHHIADLCLIDEPGLEDAIRLYARSIHQLAEGAGATALAGAMSQRSRLQGSRVGIVLSGGNIDGASLRRLLERTPDPS
jgi:threonine dehydratase